MPVSCFKSAISVLLEGEITSAARAAHISKAHPKRAVPGARGARENKAWRRACSQRCPRGETHGEESPRGTSRHSLLPDFTATAREAHTPRQMQAYRAGRKPHQRPHPSFLAHRKPRQWSSVPLGHSSYCEKHGQGGCLIGGPCLTRPPAPIQAVCMAGGAETSS
ncbi:hypothetical protein NDU88_006858 [Pleurodeles waltl]|uniref:Uncharacterized protein n=1 Tax=Pleurodeles waltl TaxID=8319 RepID=A0AAV7N8J3_PLEWA|nr:hypothetical protein NDU88_006858 [Pleurodeles waltl]